MPKSRNPDAEKAEALFRKGMKLIDISRELNLPEGTIRRWKCSYKWDSERSNKKANVRKKGGQPKNKNAKGNSGGAAPAENKNAEKHGFFTKYLPKHTQDIVAGITSLNPIDVLWQNITIQYAAILRAQQIMFVKDKSDLTKELKREKHMSGNVEGWEKEYELQFAWDKQASFLQAQSRAMTTLNGMLKQYDEMVHTDWSLATEEQKERIRKLRAEIERITGENNETEDLTETDAEIYG